MVQVLLVAEAWTKLVDVEDADELIDAEGMSWERDGVSGDDRGDSNVPADAGADVPRYVPAVSG